MLILLISLINSFNDTKSVHYMLVYHFFKLIMIILHSHIVKTVNIAPDDDVIRRGTWITYEPLGKTYDTGCLTYYLIH